jgi:hypothetical protein
LWHHREGLERLREIDERHGIRPDDPRVYSIAAYLAEKREIEDEWEQSRRERQAFRRANPDIDIPYDSDNWVLYHNRLGDCVARHFPGTSPLTGPERVDSCPKLWHYIQTRLSDFYRSR